MKLAYALWVKIPENMPDNSCWRRHNRVYITIESLAYLLKQCHMVHTGIHYKGGKPCDDTGSITGKYSEYKWR